MLVSPSYYRNLATKNDLTNPSNQKNQIGWVGDEIKDWNKQISFIYIAKAYIDNYVFKRVAFKKKSLLFSKFNVKL